MGLRLQVEATDGLRFRGLCDMELYARHVLCDYCLKQLQREPMNAEKMASMDLIKPSEMDHSVPMEGALGFLPMPCSDVFKTDCGFVNLHWRRAAKLYLAEKRPACHMGGQLEPRTTNTDSK